MFGNKIKIRKELLDQAKLYAGKMGYATVEEFIEHCIEKEINKPSPAEDDETIKHRLKGLGYIS